LSRPAQTWQPHLALVAVQLFFGTWPIFGKIALRGLPSTGLVAIRVCGASLAFIILRRATGSLRLARRSDYARLALYSLLGVVLNQLFYVKGLALSTAVNASLINTAIPITALLVSLFFGYERLSLRVVLGMLIAAGGVVYLVDPLHAALSRETLRGNLLLIGNTCVYGAYIAISQDMIKRYGALTVITWVFIFACIPVLPVGGYYLAQTPLTHLSAAIWLAVLYIVAAPTVGAYYLNAWALGRVTPSIVAIYCYLQPLFAFALAPLMLGERLTSRLGLASLLIFAGVALVTLSARTRAVKEASEPPEAFGL
jgi:drug/metabolite transporter (DMT)-like permease